MQDSHVRDPVYDEPMSIPALSLVEAAHRRSADGTTDATFSVLDSIPAWWSARASAAGLEGEWLDVTSALVAQPPAPLEPDSAGLDPHVSAHRLGQAYVDSLTADSRSRHGRHYTPEPLAQRLWAMARTALGWGSNDRVLPGLVRDPAAGAGALLLPVIREHLRASEVGDPILALSALPNHIHGVDTDPWAVYIANLVLAAETLPTLARVPERLRRPAPQLVEVGDGLAEHLPPALVNIQNPPYGRIGLSADQRARFSDSVYGHANLYGLFMAASTSGLANGGVLAALVPTGFTAGLYFHRLRAMLAETAPLHSITFVEDRSGVFSGVLQETCLAVFSRRRHQKVHVTRTNGHITRVADVPVPRGSAPWLMPRESVDAEIAAAAAKMPQTLADTGWKASTGPLVWNRRKPDIASRPSVRRVPILWASDMRDGRLVLSAGRRTQRYLTLSQLSDDSVMVLSEPAVLVQRTTAPEQPRRLVAANLDPETLENLGGRVVIENHVNVLRPISLLTSVSQDLLCRMLNSRTLDRVVRCISGTVALSAYELASLPLPDDGVLAEWEQLDGEKLEAAIADAYRLGRAK